MFCRQLGKLGNRKPRVIADDEGCQRDGGGKQADDMTDQYLALIEGVQVHVGKEIGQFRRSPPNIER